ncbi:MAG: hypothetical protein Q4B13_00300 [Lautropia sp.]|nr:hypothetical protein [Lautropia sp.]
MAVPSFLNRLTRPAGNASWVPFLLGGLFLLVGALVGLVVATGNLILIALVLGGIAGVLLLNALPVAVWFILVGVLLINGPVGYFSPGMAKISWLFSLLGIFMAGAAMLYTVAGSKHFQRPLPPFIYTSLAFIVLAVVSGVISDGPITEVAAGAKRYFQFWGVMFLMAVVPFTERQVRNWLLFIIGVGLMQLPFTLYQRVALVPGVMGYDKPGFVPFDIIVGTFEGSMTGGGASSIMAMLQVMILFAVFCAWREKLISGFWSLLLAVALLIPLGLGETKVVLIMMPVVLFAAYFDLVAKRPLAFLGIVVATLFFGAILGYFYFVVQTSGDIANMSFDENLRDTIEYNFGNRGYYATGVNRLTAVPYWFESQSWNNPIKALFGTGIGSSYGVDGLVPDPGHMFLAHPGMYIDLLTTSTVLWDFGIVGFILYFMIIFGAMRSVATCFKEANTALDRVLCRILMSSLAVTLLMAVYSNSAVVLVSHAFIVSLTLGLVAWRYRHGPLAPTRADLLQAGNASRVRPHFGGGAKVIFPTDGVLQPQELAWQKQRLLVSSGNADVADHSAHDAASPDMTSASAGAAYGSGSAAGSSEGVPEPAGQGVRAVFVEPGNAVPAFGPAPSGGHPPLNDASAAAVASPVRAPGTETGSGLTKAPDVSAAPMGAPASDAADPTMARGAAALARLAQAGQGARSAFPAGVPSSRGIPPKEGRARVADFPASSPAGQPDVGVDEVPPLPPAAPVRSGLREDAPPATARSAFPAHTGWQSPAAASLGRESAQPRGQRYPSSAAGHSDSGSATPSRPASPFPQTVAGRSVERRPGAGGAAASVPHGLPPMARGGLQPQTRRPRQTGHFGPRPQHIDLAEPSAWGRVDNGQGSWPDSAGHSRNPHPKREPVIDDPGGPRTLPMFADDDEPANSLAPRSGSGWLDPRDTSRRR